MKKIEKLTFLFLMASSLISMNQAFASASNWDQLRSPYKELYSKVILEQQGTNGRQVIDSAFTQDQEAFQKDPTFRCRYPYRYKLLTTAGMVPHSGSASQECGGRPTIVSSTDEAVIGQSFFLANLDPKKIKRIQIGKSKSGTFNFGHSFVKLDLCIDEHCEKPKEIVIHPGTDKNGNLIYGARTYADMLATAKTKKDLGIDLVDLDLSNNEVKENFLAALFERTQHGSGKYKLTEHNCATSIDDLMQFSNMSLDSSLIKTRTPSGVLTKAEKLSKKPRKTVKTYEQKANDILKELIVTAGLPKTNYDRYSKQPSEKRYCSINNENGIKKKIDRSVGELGVAEAAIGIGETRNQESKNLRMCNRAKKAAAKTMNLVMKCAELENQILFDKKTQLNKDMRKGNSPQGDRAKKLDQLRSQFLSKLGEAARLANPAPGQEMTQKEFLEHLNEIGKDKEGERLNTEIMALSEEIKKESAAVEKVYKDQLRKAAGENQGDALINYYHDRLEKEGGLLAQCNTMSCPITTGGSP